VTGTIVLLSVVSLLTDVSSEMVAAVPPLYLTVHVGLGLLAYGFVDGMCLGVTAVVGHRGRYAGRRPKPVATLGYGLSAVSRIALLPARTASPRSRPSSPPTGSGKGLHTAPPRRPHRRRVVAPHTGRHAAKSRTLDLLG
jgi:hypothetical protein